MLKFKAGFRKNMEEVPPPGVGGMVRCALYWNGVSTFSETLSNTSGICQLFQYNKRQQYQEKKQRMSTKSGKDSGCEPWTVKCICKRVSGGAFLREGGNETLHPFWNQVVAKTTKHIQKCAKMCKNCSKMNIMCGNVQFCHFYALKCNFLCAKVQLSCAKTQIPSKNNKFSPLPCPWLRTIPRTKRAESPRRCKTWTVNFICKRISGGRFARRVSQNATPLFAAKDVALKELTELTSRIGAPGLNPRGGDNDKTSALNRGTVFEVPCGEKAKNE